METNGRGAIHGALHWNLMDNRDIIRDFENFLTLRGSAKGKRAKKSWHSSALVPFNRNDALPETSSLEGFPAL
jgi:hypothetical protein